MLTQHLLTGAFCVALFTFGITQDYYIKLNIIMKLKNYLLVSNNMWTQGNGENVSTSLNKRICVTERGRE